MTALPPLIWPQALEGQGEAGWRERRAFLSPPLLRRVSGFLSADEGHPVCLVQFSAGVQSRITALGGPVQGAGPDQG
jgi:hypothetical protein